MSDFSASPANNDGSSTEPVADTAAASVTPEPPSGAAPDADTLLTPSLSDPEQVPVAMTSPTAEAVIWPVRVASEWAGRLLIIALAIYVVAMLLERISVVAFAIILALFFTAVLKPVEGRVRRAFGGRKSLSTTVVLLGGIVVFGLVAWFVVAQISSHSGQLSDQVSRVGDRLREWLKDGPFHLKDKDVDDAITNLTNAIKSHQGELVSSAVSTVSTLLEWLGGLFLSLIATFFLLRDGDIVWRWVLRLIPRSARPRVDRAGERGWHSLGGYIRGQVSIAVIHAVTITVALLILRVPLAAALGVIIFLGSFIPILGLTIAGALCVGVTLLEHGLTAAIIILIIIVVLVQAEGNVLQPLIMSRAVHIHPLAVAIAVAAGTTLYGIVGALIAVPLVAFANSFIRGLRDEPLDPVTEEPEAADSS
jgi:predicted PurR-regulated permease PerM